jgi:hypothetical protein
MKKLIVLTIALAILGCKEKGGEGEHTFKYITDNPDIVVASEEADRVYEVTPSGGEDCKNGSEEDAQSEEHEYIETEDGKIAFSEEGEVTFEGQVVEIVDPCDIGEAFFKKDEKIYRVYLGTDLLLHVVALNHHETQPVSHIQSVAGSVCMFTLWSDWSIEVTAQY